MSATLKTAMPDGAIRSQRIDADISDYLAGRPVAQRLVIGVVQVESVTVESQQSGRVNKARYTPIHLIEVTDPHEVDQLRHRISQLRANAGLEMSQPGLFAMTESEQVESLKDLIKDQASALDMPMAEVDARFVEYFGGAENANAETVQASRSATQLKEFAYVVGAIAETEQGEPEPEAESEPEA